MKRQVLDQGKYDLVLLASATRGWNGAEIEQSVASARIACYAQSRAVEERDLLLSMGQIVRLSTTMSEQIKAIRGWARTRALPATTTWEAGDVRLDLGRVPLRDASLTPYEMLLSESQEGMLMVAKAGKEEECIRICKKWDLDVAVVGKVTGSGVLRVLDQGNVVAEIPAKSLADDGPRYERPYSPPGYQDMLTNLNYDALPDVKDANAALLALLESPTIASKRWVYEQYDHMVRTNTMVRPGSDAAVVRIKGTNKAVAMTVDCNSRYSRWHAGRL